MEGGSEASTSSLNTGGGGRMAEARNAAVRARTQIAATAESAAAAANSLVRRSRQPKGQGPLLVDAETGLAQQPQRPHLPPATPNGAAARRAQPPASGIDNGVLSYSNLVAQESNGGPPDGVLRPVDLRLGAGSGSGREAKGEKGDASLDISRGSEASSSGRWSVLGSERSWTPSAVSEATDRIRNWEAWGRINSFVIVMCVLITVHGTLTSGYINSMVTSIEKRFDIRSRESGMILSSYEIGSLLSVVFVSYFGSQGHIPRWIGIGGIMISVGAILWTVPHWAVENLVAAGGGHQSSASESLCHSTPNASHTNQSCGDAVSHAKYIVFPFIAQIIIGAGGSPIFTLGTTYIDNHVPKESSSVFLAIMYVFVAVGPVIGYCLGAAFSKLYVNEHVPASFPADFGPESPAWIGRWWAGFILCGVLYFVAALPFFGFPRRLPNINLPEATQEAQKAAQEYGKSIKKIPFSIFRLLTNSVYMVASLCACMDLAIVSGFTAFLPKYIESQFGQDKSIASIFTGTVAVPGACVGIFLGGWLLKRFNLNLKGVAKLVLSVNIFCLFGLVLFFFVGCDNPKIEGFEESKQQFVVDTANFKISETSQETPDEKFKIKISMEKGRMNLTAQCNRACACLNKDYLPVCGADGQTYFSPCVAGCASGSGALSENTSAVSAKITYGACLCVKESKRFLSGQLMPKMTVTSGMCDRGTSCTNMLYMFLVLLFFLTLVASLSQMPLVMVTLRAVSEEEKAFALGVQVVLFRLFAYIPAPIVFGSLIDTSCVFAKPSACEGGSSTCLIYDIQHFRYRYGIIAMVIKVAAACLSGVLLLAIKRRGEVAEEPFSPPITMSEIAHRLGDVDNLHIRNCQPSGNMRSWMSDDSLYSRPRSPRKHQKTLSC